MAVALVVVFFAAGRFALTNLNAGVDARAERSPAEIVPCPAPKNTTTRSERTYRCRRTRWFGVMRAEQGACVRRRSWAGYTINMLEFEFPTGTTAGPE
jgi:hypothetical protein